MDKELLIQELKFKAVRSSGAGGQHVNKVSSKVAVYFNIGKSNSLTDQEKSLILKKLSHKLTKEKVLVLWSEETRSQHKNKERVIEKLLEMLEAGLRKPKPRRKTRPTRASKEKRLRQKKQLAQKKAYRGKPSMD
ncbi:MULTISPECIES: alternative ribosome rescue aminoacyl-tRNA hydrolase ArfB [Arenibacter]|uniref:alternative ribosome rescue aminoacyl-tRNA hydrolase ArfB n=1 Tax=Arenibacter TaxID=178469 RepID=UPI000A3C3F83|nr:MULTISPECIES: alternative ribosome rescue aminoacyl-tRNA hydrolase ArfB [Arenibacter]